MTVLPKRNASKSKAETNSSRLEKKRWLSRALKLETLEKRELFAADLPAFHNGLIPHDVDLDYSVGPLDALAVINSLNERGSSYLGGTANDNSTNFFDVDGDDFLTPLDALSVINFINSGEGVGELASIRYQFYAANPDGTPNLNRLLGQTDGATPPVIDIGVGEQIVIRTQVNDLRNQNIANPLRRYGVFSAYHDLRYENLDGSTEEKLELMWGEYNEVFIPTSVTSGSFQLQFAATAETPARTVQINPAFVAAGGLDFAATRVAIFNALQTAFGTGTIRIADRSPVRDGFLGFGFNFQRNLSRLNIGDATIANNTLSASGIPVTPQYTNDANPSPSALRTTTPARNHALRNSFVNAFGNTISSGVSYIDGPDGTIRPPVNVRLATTQNHVLTGNFSAIENIETIDGVALVPGDRILVRAQTNQSENGIYVVTDITAESVTKRTLVRSLDADQSSELIDAFVVVTAGSRSGQRFLQKTPNVNLGTSPIVWGAPNVTVLERFGGFSGLEIEDNFGASQYFNVIDVLFRGGKAGVVELDAELSEVPTGTNPNVTRNLGLALHSTSTYITDPSLIIMPSNVRIRILDELTAFPDRYTLNEDAPATLLDVMGGSEPDVDRLGRSFTIVGVNNTSDKATVSVANNGTRVQFTPTADANGEVVFTYTIQNTNGNRATGTVTVTINATNDAPIPLTPALSVNEDRGEPGLVITPATLFSAGPADEVAAGQTVTLTGTPTSPNGTVNINGDGNLTFIPARNFNGPATITVTGRDSVGAERSAVFTVTVTHVNDAPIAGTTSFQTNEDTALPAIAATTLFSPGPTNESSQTITLTVPTPPPSSQGTVTLPNNGTSLVFNPAPNFFGDVVFAVRGTDNGVGTAANPSAPNPLFTDSMITIRVSPVNDAPTAANDSLSAIAAVGLAQTLDVMALGSTSSGRDSAGPLEDVPGGDTIRVVRVTQPVNAANPNLVGGRVEPGPNGANVIFTPDGSVIDGTVTFTYTIRDLDGAANGLESTATVTLRIVPPARPYAIDDSFTVDEDSGSRSFNVLTGTSGADFVRPGSTAELVSVASIPAQQGIVRADGNNIEFTPAGDFSGTIVFSYTMRDSSNLPAEPNSRETANVTVVVRELNDAPVAVELTRTTAEDVDLLMSAASITDGLSRGAPNESAQTLTITDARLVNPAAGTIERRRNGDFFDIFYDPADNFFGQAIIEYTVTDNGTDRGVATPRSSTSRILVNVTPVNDPPITVNKSFNAVEDTAARYSINSIIANDLPGPVNEGVSLNQTLSFDGLPSLTSTRGGTLAIDGADVVYTPARDFFGTDTFTYRVRDNEGLTTLGTVTVTVSEINDAPVAVNVSRQDRIFASVRTVLDLRSELAQMSRGASDQSESGQTLRIVAVGRSANGVQPTIGADGVSIIYTAPLGANGPDSFTYTIEDNGTSNGVSTPLRSTATVNVTVLPFIPSSFSGTVWIDEDAQRNNVIDNGELLVAGADVYLFEGTMENQPPRSTWRHEVTDSEGYYSFELLPPGTYTVMFMVPGMMLDSTAANHFSQVIQAPGDVHVSYDFAVYGSVAGLGSQLEYLSSSYYQTDAGMRNDGFVAAVAADGTSLWTVARGDVGDDLFHEVVLSSDSRTAFITSIRANGDVFTTSVGRNQFRRVIDPTTGGTLIRVLARVSELSWTRVNMASPPVNSAAKFLDSIDEFFATMADDPRP